MKASTLRGHARRMARLLDHLRGHLNEPLKIDALARIGGVSPRQVDRLFIRLFGESARACLRRLRLERAGRELRETSEPILAIALDAGFDSHESFTRSFSRHFGRNPSVFRELPRANLQPQSRQAYWTLAFAGRLRSYVERRETSSIRNG